MFAVWKAQPTESGSRRCEPFPTQHRFLRAEAMRAGMVVVDAMEARCATKETRRWQVSRSPCKEAARLSRHPMADPMMRNAATCISGG